MKDTTKVIKFFVTHSVKRRDTYAEGKRVLHEGPVQSDGSTFSTINVHPIRGGYYTKTSKLTYDFEKEKVWVCIVLWLQQTYNKMKKNTPFCCVFWRDKSK